MKLILINGQGGSGKSSVARALVSEIKNGNAIFIDTSLKTIKKVVGEIKLAL